MFDWLGESPAPGLQWLDLVVSLVAFGFAVVAMPTILQSFLGGPKLSLEFDFKNDRAWEGNREFICHISNRPVNIWLRRCGVRREAANGVAIDVTLTDRSNGDSFSVNVTRDERHVHVPASEAPVSFSIGTVGIWEGGEFGFSFEGRVRADGPSMVRDVVYDLVARGNAGEERCSARGVLSIGSTVADSGWQSEE